MPKRQVFSPTPGKPEADWNFCIDFRLARRASKGRGSTTQPSLTTGRLGNHAFGNVLQCLETQNDPRDDHVARAAFAACTGTVKDTRLASLGRRVTSRSPTCVLDLERPSTQWGRTLMVQTLQASTALRTAYQHEPSLLFELPSPASTPRLERRAIKATTQLKGLLNAFTLKSPFSLIAAPAGGKPPLRRKATRKHLARLVPEAKSFLPSEGTNHASRAGLSRLGLAPSGLSSSFFPSIL